VKTTEIPKTAKAGIIASFRAIHDQNVPAAIRGSVMSRLQPTVAELFPPPWTLSPGASRAAFFWEERLPQREQRSGRRLQKFSQFESTNKRSTSKKRARCAGSGAIEGELVRHDRN